MTVYFNGYTAKTPRGPVDMVPLMRRLNGDLKAPINESERDAAVLALHALGVPVRTLPSLLDISWETAQDVLSGKRRQRADAFTPPQSREDKNDRWRALVLRRKAERVEVDGRLVHPSCVHGEASSYKNYGCQCDPCTVAHRVKMRAQNARRKAREAVAA